ncbi:MAG: hypothetical protein QNK05_04315 [Myxococcota bacterium]|nr:hypothetical protein [Myxococcota bacterium]
MPARRARFLLPLALLSVALLGSRCMHLREPHPREVGLRGAGCAVDITPVVGVNHSDPIYMAGFGQNRDAQGVRDPIWARGVVLEQGDTKLAIVTLDVVGYFYNEVQTIRALVDPARGFDSITVTSTHNHEGPDTMGLWGADQLDSGVDLQYLDFVNDSVVECIESADDALTRAAIKFATGSTMGASLPPWPDLVADGEVLQPLLVNVPGEGPLQLEGDPGPILNPSVPTFQVRERRTPRQRVIAFFRWLFGRGSLSDAFPLGDTLATLVNYASHPEALGSGNRLLTSDFPHAMREALEARYGGVAIYMSADLGVLQGPLDVDMNDLVTGDPIPRRTFEFADEMGLRLAERAMIALESERFWDGDPEVAIASSGTIQVVVENPFFQVLGSLGIFGRRGLLQANDEFIVETEVQAIRIGNAQILVTPNELDPQIGNLYRDLMTGADHKFVAGLGNDEIGYQMPEAKFNPSCFICFTEVLFGNEDECPVLETLDCGTVFQNNLGPGADPVLQAVAAEQLDAINP